MATLRLQWSASAEEKRRCKDSAAPLLIEDRPLVGCLRGLPAGASLALLEEHPGCLWNQSIHVSEPNLGRWLAAYGHPSLVYDFCSAIAAEPLRLEELIFSSARDAVARAFFHNTFCFELRTSRNTFERQGALWNLGLGEAFGTQSLFWLLDDALGSTLECRLHSPSLDSAHTWRITSQLPPPLLGREALLRWFHEQ